MVMDGLIILAVVVFVIVLVISGGGRDSSYLEEIPKKSKRSRELEYFEKKYGDTIDLFDSDNENDWRMAIIEADILIINIMRFSGVYGNNHGEKISNLSSNKINKKALYSLHRIRNRVAHQGVGYHLDRDQVNQIKKTFENAMLMGND